MKEQEIQDELTSIRSLMERSSKFISLSGLSGILAGVYALIGAVLAYSIIYADGAFPHTAIADDAHGVDQVNQLLLIAVGVLAISIITGIVLTIRKAKNKGQQVWGNTSKQLLFNMAIPLVAGGVFILILISRSYFGIVAPASLIFYGMALLNASNITYRDIRYLGISEVLLGLLAAWAPGYGLLFWAVGFGILHIVYGSIMYLKYDR